MNEYEARGVALPEGCKDLIDMLPRFEHKPQAGHACRGGLADLSHWLSWLLSDPAVSKSLTVIWPRQAEGIHLFWGCGELSVLLTLRGRETNHEIAIRSIFGEAGLTPITDELAAGPTPGQVLRYQLPAQLSRAAELLQDVLLRGCVAPERSVLMFHYYERA